MPLGFMDGGAAPIADVGAQLRGSFTTATAGQFNYSGFVANGPTLEAGDGDIEAIATEGGTGNADGNFTAGGRIGWLPIPTLEIAGSYARGRVRDRKSVVEGRSVSVRVDIGGRRIIK